jgi:transposase
MITNHGNLHLEIQTSRKNPVGLLRTTYRENSKIKHEQHGRITGCSLQQLKLLQLAFREQVIPVNAPEAFTILNSREWGASYALMELAKQIGLPKLLYSRNEPWVQSAMAMIIGRLVYPGSKLSLCHQQQSSCLWELCGITETPTVDEHCYPVMDKLLKRQKAIQKILARKHLNTHHMVLYDITSVYFEGDYEDSQLVKFGYNRDKKKGKEQVVVGLICNDDGCPVGLEVFAGNTKDETTVLGKIREVKQEYQLKQVIFVGDRGMVTKSNLEALQDDHDIKTVSALTHGDLKNLWSREVITPDLFDQTLINEVFDPETPTRRYCLCRNEATESRERKTRERLLELTIEGLQYIAGYKRRTTVEKLGARVGKILAKYKMGKFIQWSIDAADEDLSNQHRLVWDIDNEKIAQEKRLDGCYIISTDVDIKTMDTQQVVKTYKSLGYVEQAFRTMKTTHLHVRPVFHKTDARICSHLFLCMLSYYLQWHMRMRLKPLFEADGEYENRRWTVKGVIECLASITRNKVSVGDVIFYRNSKPTDEQQKILDLLEVSL